jgi:hypothetical protein
MVIFSEIDEKVRLGEVTGYELEKRRSIPARGREFSSRH